MQPHDQLRARQRILLGADVDVEVRIQLVERAHLEIVDRADRVEHCSARARTARVRMGVNHANHAALRVDLPES
jgi:hypothetical protein